MFETIVVILLFGLMFLCYFNMFRKRLSPAKKVRAQLVEKYTYAPVSKHQPGRKEYVLVFETENGKRLSFNVSEFSYGGYKEKKRGTLKYKGDMILEFK